jgi:hypothetical protein
MTSIRQTFQTESRTYKRNTPSVQRSELHKSKSALCRFSVAAPARDGLVVIL